MRPPRFWSRDGALPRLLSPISAAVGSATARRVARPGWEAPVPVLCCGNAGVGGAGKTTVALDLLRRLRARGLAVHCLSRGYRGRVRGGRRVDVMRDSAADVGDEPLMLAELAPTWVGADRAVTARLAVAAGAQALVMDDGLQNPTLGKTASLLVVDGAAGFGNGRVLPAGPLRESPAAAARRCRAAVLIGPDQTGVQAELRPLPVLAADLVSDARLDGMRVFAFSGIARPSKFHATLLEAGADLVGALDFPDHHAFAARDLRRVFDAAARLGAQPITTTKDAVRLPEAARLEVEVLRVRLRWHDTAALERLLDDVLR